MCKPALLWIWLFAVVVFLLPSPLYAQRTAVELSKGWEFHEVAPEGVTPHSAETTAWHPATVPGVVQTDLLANGLIAEPFNADNEASLQWIGKTNWEYRTTFQIAAAQLMHANADLVFDGLDTFATVYLNDQKVLDADNMFRAWRVPTKKLLKPGANTLRIVFTSPIVKMQATVDALPYHLPGAAQWQQNVEAHDKPTVEPYIRKAPYNFGWDWGPRFLTAGVWRPARIEFWDKARIADIFVEQQSVTETVANLLVHVSVDADHETTATMRLSQKVLTGVAAGALQSQTASLHAGRNEIFFPVRILSPKLWWPNGYGNQDRYEFTAQVSSYAKVEDAKTARTGLRSIVLRRADDKWGRSFEFVVNGVPIFAKGANVIPFDSFPSRVKESDYRKVLQAAQDANMNMVRDWGGGYYETDQYYDMTDELGLLVWQEFMFGGGLYPGDRAFMDNVRQEAIEQVTRLRNHPSIALFCGNNESETGYFNWGDRQDFKKSLTPEQRDGVWGDYMRMFSGLLPQVVATYDPQAAYWPSSPSNNFEAPEGNTQFGDDHYWSVWHGDAPFSLYEEQYPRFMTEYGYQSFPELSTVQSFAAPEDMKIESTVMLAHQKNNSGNQIMHTALTKYFGEPKDFPSFLYATQVQQAEAIKISAEHLRRSRPHNMGTLYWQLNDCWPVASWSSLDYYGRWKALHYYARRFYAPVLVSPHEENGELAVYVVSDLTKPTSGKLTLKLADFAGKTLWTKEQQVTVAPLASGIAYHVPLTELLGNADKDGVVLRTELTGSDGKPLSSNDHFFDEISKNLKLPAVKVTASVTEKGTRKVIHLQAPQFARAVYVSFGGLDVQYGDNYFNLLAGESRDVTVTTKASVAELEKALRVVSEVDAF
jgi:beta-mannosidase